ncbi:hypothetical protein CASFOL_009855 [Castilleja foliolosa]|uniref:Bifunctional inhibitor/plant lipid transfer protein/seed storage helical domain-containing protein n=1 Tax=Castilleja foliolosa TaxID=1961234 RepID=A0ABD3DR13_9LAMI
MTMSSKAANYSSVLLLVIVVFWMGQIEPASADCNYYTTIACPTSPLRNPKNPSSECCDAIKNNCSCFSQVYANPSFQLAVQACFNGAVKCGGN